MDDQTHKAFLNAVKKGKLTIKSAHDYMFMYSRDDCDYFKNIDSREYLIVSNVGEASTMHTPAFNRLSAWVRS